MAEPLLSVRNLQVRFRGRGGRPDVVAVDDISFDLASGKTLGIVGESGSGKSVTSLALLGLLPPTGFVARGEAWFGDRDLTKLSGNDLRHIRGRQIAMIFQDPMTSLNPFLTVAEQIIETTRLHLGHTRTQAAEHAVRMLDLVGIPDARARANDYPHQFSGGMRQRVMIAMALASEPKLLIADEPTTALDVSIQAQILDLMHDVTERTGTALILITHDLGVVADLADQVVVMYAGRVMESAPVGELFANPYNPYTRALLACTPNPLHPREELVSIAGLPPDAARLDRTRCPFLERCPETIGPCSIAFPPYRALSESHSSLCLR